MLTFIQFDTIVDILQLTFTKSDVKTIVEKKGLTPDTLFYMAKNEMLESDIIFITGLNENEYSEISGKNFIDLIIGDCTTGYIFMITDEGYINKHIYTFTYNKINEFIHEYENYYSMDFVQMSDYIFILNNQISCFHHENYILKIKIPSILARNIYKD